MAILPLDLLKRSEKGSVLSGDDYDNNLSRMEDAVNYLGAQLLSRYNTFEEAIAAVKVLGKSLIIDMPYDLGGVAVDCMGVMLIWFSEGNIISNGTLQNCQLSADPIHIFSTSLTITEAKFVEAYPQWYGATGGTVGDRLAIQKTIDIIPSSGTIHIIKTETPYNIDAYSLSEALTVSNTINIILSGTLKGVSSDTKVDPPYIMNITAPSVNLKGDGSFEGVGTYQTSQTIPLGEAPGLLHVTGSYVEISEVTFKNQPRESITIAEGHSQNIYNCKFTGGPKLADLGPTDTGNFYINIIANAGKDINIKQNNFYKSEDGGAACQGITNYYAVYNSSIESNTFDGLHEHSIYTVFYESIITDNTIKYDETYINQRGYAIVNVGVGSTISLNKINNSLKGGIGLRGSSYSTITLNNITGCGLNGISISPIGYGPTDINFNKINLNTIVGSLAERTEFGILVATNENSTAPVSGTDISKNTIVNYSNTSGYSSISLKGIAGLMALDSQIKANLIYAPGQNTDCPGISLDYCQDSEIAGNKFFNPGAEVFNGIISNNSKYLDINYNTLDNAVSGSKYLRLYNSGVNSTNIELTNNKCYGSTYTEPLDNLFSLSRANNILGRGNRISKDDSLRGTFTMNGVSTLVVSNKNMMTNPFADKTSYVQITPLTANAATVMSSTQILYVSDVVGKTSFTVSTADGTPLPSVDHTFAYEILQ